MNSYIYRQSLVSTIWQKTKCLNISCFLLCHTRSVSKMWFQIVIWPTSAVLIALTSSALLTFTHLSHLFLPPHFSSLLSSFHLCSVRVKMLVSGLWSCWMNREVSYFRESSLNSLIHHNLLCCWFSIAALSLCIVGESASVHPVQHCRI